MTGPRVGFTRVPFGPAVPDTAAGDWLTIRPNGTPELDVRMCLRTTDGADVFVRYHGLIRDNAKRRVGHSRRTAFPDRRRALCVARRHLLRRRR